MAGLTDHKTDNSVETGADLGTKHNSFITAILTAFDILAGVLTFKIMPKTPEEAPDEDYQVANKKYVDDMPDDATIELSGSGKYQMKGGGGMIKVSSVSFSAESSKTITGLSPGKRYKLLLNIKQNTVDGAPFVQFNGDTGSNYKWVWIRGAYNGVGASGIDTADKIYLTDAVDVIKADGYFMGEFSFRTAPGDNTIIQLEGGSGTRPSMQGYTIHENIYGYYDGASDLSSIKIGATAGTFTGTAELYEIV